MQKNIKSASGNIILVGMMGSGKSTVGRSLAKQLGKRFFDTDHEIQLRTGVTINHIFDVEGEAGFRLRETAELKEILAQSNIVLATGGGAILAERNRHLMGERGIVIYLQASVNELWQRTRHDKSRPLLQCNNPIGTLENLYAERNELYLSVADITLKTGRQSVQSLVQQIEQEIEKYKINSMGECVMSQTIRVELDARSYEIHIGSGVSTADKLLVPHIPKGKVAIVTNTTVAPLYLSALQSTLSENGIKSSAIVLPDGEQHKTIDSMRLIYDALLQNKCERSTPLIALGGGVIGDMTGFAAATYLRGVPFIQIPTTLLSQVDSSVGGKTGINHPLGKNMIGAFYQPQVVLADLDTLTTLPDREYSAGLAEVIKYGLIKDKSFFEWLEENIEALILRNPSAMSEAITQSCRNKAEIVGRDEFESGVRALLNLGHTFGHAIESGMGYGVWLHGEAVAAGTVMAADLSHRMGWLRSDELMRIKELITKAGLSIVAPRLGVENYLELMGMDKKVESGKLRFVLLKEIGKAIVESDVPHQKLIETIECCSNA